MAWYDDEPVRGGYPDPRMLALSGLERMRAGVKRTVPAPPISHLFGLRPVAAGPASVTFSMPCSDWLQSDAGVYFAGTSALVADGALSGAVLAPLGPGQVCVTAGTHVVHRGRSLTVAQGDIVNADGKKVVVMTASAAIRGGGSWGSLVDPDEVMEKPAEAAP